MNNLALLPLFGFVLLNVCAAQTRELANGHITATFGPRGLISISSRESRDTVQLDRDEFSIAIGEVQLDSAKLTPKVAQSSASVLTYTYESQGYRVKVIYKVLQDWRFVSKELEVSRSTNGSYVVHHVEPLRETLTEPVSSEFTPGTYLPQFGDSDEFPNRVPHGKFGTFLRFWDNRGLMLLGQNPFLEVSHESNNVSIKYDPEMTWQSNWGPFVSDAACLGLYHLSGQRIPEKMVLEWRVPPAAIADDGADLAEIRAYTDCVREFLITPSAKPISVEVGWTLNDYQIDVSKPEGQEEYKRIIDTTSDLGIGALLYGPANYDLAQIANDSDDWDWEHVLWLGLGQQIREGEWDVSASPVPSSITEMTNYAHKKHVGLLAYVYPSLPFAQNPAWLVTDKEKPGKNVFATLSSREFQDFLIKELLTFKQRTGIAGYSFDYTFLTVPGSSAYSQWWGWRRIMESLRRAEPGIIIDGRQTYQAYGPWSWTSGSYPHPIGNDEQPESFQPYPDLHFDRVSADRERFVDYWYRNYQFAPQQIIPGYATHQTERYMNVHSQGGTDGHSTAAKMMYTSYRQRDWDYLGYRYSFISSIATGGWNNVVNMIPARDREEFLNFSSSDKAWIRHWLEWTDANSEYLKRTQTILGQPAIGKADGTSALLGDRGYLFLFNPNYKGVSAEFLLDTTMGLSAGTKFLLREVYPREGRLLGKPGVGTWSYGDQVQLNLQGTSATVLEVTPMPATLVSPFVFNSADRDASAYSVGDTLIVDHASGEPGSKQEIGVLLPDAWSPKKVLVNGGDVHFSQVGPYVSAHVKFAGQSFTHSQEINLETSSDGTLTGSFVVPKRVLSQLSERRKQWPIPWTEEDYGTTWLAPERLFVFVQIAEAKENEEPAIKVDGRPLNLRKAYSSVRDHTSSFVGFYADLSEINPDVKHTMEVQLPELRQGQFQGIFFDNVEPEYTEAAAP